MATIPDAVDGAIITAAWGDAVKDELNGNVPKLTPGATQTIVAQAPTVTPLILQGASAQSADFVRILDSTGAVVLEVNADGSELHQSDIASAGAQNFVVRNKNATASQTRFGLERNGDAGTGVVRGGVQFANSTAYGIADYEARFMAWYTGTAAGAASERMRLQADGNLKTNAGKSTTGISSPAQLTAATDNYAPANQATSHVLRISSNAALNLTGLVAEPTGVEHLLLNVGAFTITLKHDVTSTAANRFLCPGSVDLALLANAAVRLWYDVTSARWRVLSK